MKTGRRCEHSEAGQKLKSQIPIAIGTEVKNQKAAMRIVSTSYSKSPEFNNPVDWLKRISFYTGILEQIAVNNEVMSIERIDFEGDYVKKEVRYYFFQQKARVVFFPFRTHRLIRKVRPDAVLINGFIFPLQIIQLRLFVGRKVKIIILHRAEKPFSNWKKYLQRLADGCVNAYLFASSAFGKEWVNRGIIKNQAKVHEVMQSSSSFFSTDKQVARSALNVAGDPVFLWVGRLDANKDPVTVVKAFIQYLLYQPVARLYMIFQQEQLLAEVSDLINNEHQAAAAIRLIGLIPHGQLQSWYNSADFIISGSHYEGSGIAVCEAMSCGCIPLLTDIASFRSMTGHGKCGLLYEPGNEKDLLAVLVQTRQMDVEKEREKVLRQFRDELSFEAIAGKIEKVITAS